MAIIQDCIATVIEKMDPEEKGMLKCVLLYGKKLQEEAGEIINSPENLKTYGEDVTTEWVASRLNDEFSEGLGLSDALNNLDDEYANQLNFIINKVLVKSLKVEKPVFSQSLKSIAGAIQRERWIAEKLMNSMITNMDEDARVEFTKEVAQVLKEKGIPVDKAAQASTALFVGGLTAARAIMGFGFHKMVAVIANLIVRMLMGRGLTLAANAALQRFVGVFFGPIGLIITGLTLFPLISSLLNPRGYDKYIPAVFIIGVTRISQND